MKEKSGWNILLEDAFFKHRYVSRNSGPDYGVLNRLLEVIHGLLFSKNISFSTENSQFELPDRDNDKETLGFNINFLQQWLSTALNRFQREGAAFAAYPCLGRYLKDGEFRRYVDNLLYFIISKAGTALPELKDTLPSREEREEDTQRENNLELTEMVERAANAQRAAQEAQDAVERAQKEVERAQDEAQKAQKAAESVMPNMLTTLGVFIAIVIAVVACYLTLLMTQHMDPGMRPLDLGMILVMGHILINVIFLLLYLISKMSNHPLACKCPVGRELDCGQCRPELRQHCNWGNKLLLRYPYMVLLNGLFFLGYLGLGLWQLFRPYWEGAVLPALQSNWLTALFWVVVALGALVFACVRYLRSPAKREAQHAEKRQKKDNQRASIGRVEKSLKKLEQWQQTQQRQTEEQQRLLEELRRELDTLTAQQQQEPAGVQPPQ